MNAFGRSELDRLRTEGEGLRLEFKSGRLAQQAFSPSKDSKGGKQNLLKAIAALANREGGYLLIGVSDNKELEGKWCDDPAALASKIADLLRQRTSPKADFSPSFYCDDAADVLAIYVHRRSGMPIAVVDKSDDQIVGRTYYLRTESSSVLADDVSLAWMFTGARGAFLERELQIGIPYRRDDLNILWPRYPSSQPATVRHLLWWLLNKTPGFQNDRSREHEWMPRLMSELVPAAILMDLARVYRHSWEVRMVSRLATTGMSHGGTNSSMVLLRDVLHWAGNGHLVNTGFTLDSTTGQSEGSPLAIALPPEGRLTVELEPRTHRTVIRITARAVELEIRISGLSWSKDWPRGLSPMLSDGLKYIELQPEGSASAAFVELGCSIRGHLTHRAIDSLEAEAEVAWMRQLADFVARSYEWDGMSQQEADVKLALIRLQRIHDDLRRTARGPDSPPTIGT